MKDYLQGWKNVKDVYIPPVKQKGFKENVIIRKYMPAKKVERIVMEMEEDDATVFVPMDEDYDDDRTVIVPEGIPGFVMIKRLKTGEIIKVGGQINYAENKTWNNNKRFSSSNISHMFIWRIYSGNYIDGICTYGRRK